MHKTLPNIGYKTVDISWFPSKEGKSVDLVELLYVLGTLCHSLQVVAVCSAVSGDT